MRILIIGDKINPNNKGKSIWEAKSLKFLKEFVLDDSPLEYEFINSVDIKNKKDLLRVWGHCGQVICLGRDSQKRIKDITGFKFRYVPHPSFWLRFKYKQLLDYKRIFMEAIK